MEFIQWVDYAGTFVFAISGVLAAIDKKFDVIGAIVIGLVTAVGGGTLRDILIGSTPVGWMKNEIYIYIILIAIPTSLIFKNQISRFRKSMFLFDTIGIGLFTILGLNKTLAFGLSPTVALIMGVTSAVFGGVIRDVLINEIPLIFRKEIYATACLAGGIMYLILEKISEFKDMNIVISILLVMVIRILSVRYHWSLSLQKTI